MEKCLCKIISLDDVVKMTETGIVPHQQDDLVHQRLCLYPREMLNEARDIYFPGMEVRGYYMDMKKLDDSGYVVFWEDQHTCTLIGPKDAPMQHIPIGCLHNAVLGD